MRLAQWLKKNENITWHHFTLLLPMARFSFITSFIGFLCLIFSWAVYAQTEKIETIKIGLSGPFSGGSAPMGESMRHGVRIAAEEINLYMGGVLGKRIELIERDDRADPRRGAVIADELIHKEKVVATVGIVNTGVGLTSIDRYQQAKIPLIIAVSTGTALTQKYAPPATSENYIFRVSPRTDIETAFLINHIVDKAKIKKIGIIADTTPYGEAGKTDLLKALAIKRLRPVGIERFNIGDTDMTMQLLALKAVGAETLVMYGIGPELAAIAKSKDAMKWNIPLYSGWTASTQNFIELAGKSSEGVMMPQTFIQQSNNDRRMLFVMSYAQRYGRGVMPSPMSAAQGYDAMRILFNAIVLSGSTEGQKIKIALENLSYPIEGIIATHVQPFTFMDHDAISLNMLVMGIVRHGKAEYAFNEDSNKSIIMQRKQAQKK